MQCNVIDVNCLSSAENDTATTRQCSRKCSFFSSSEEEEWPLFSITDMQHQDERQQQRDKNDFDGQKSLKFEPSLSRWQSVVQKIGSLRDPWTDFQLINLPTENCLRHRYSAMRQKWIVDDVQVKLHPDQFARGAMRECFRLKKLSKFSKSLSWVSAQNYVAKRYIQMVDKTVIFEDVTLQMDAKLWAEEYNRHNPPKKIDIVQVTVLEFVDRPGRPLYHLEHFIEGNYIKYNSNSGFVSETCRQTPQVHTFVTFSHFTFERSDHRLIVVDIQGVEDLYTDPQIHTVDGIKYGGGNLGTRGMALFFHSHKCNDICEGFDLTPFDLAPGERRDRERFVTSMVQWGECAN